MSNYVMSDVHGQYKSYMKMLKKIDLKTDDTLYVLGDAIDRGPDGIKILADIMKRPNVVMILGNHEMLMMDALKNFDEIKSKDRHDTDDIDLWLDPCNGGESTYEEYTKLSASKRKAILDYLENAWIIKKIKINNKTYHLSHFYYTIIISIDLSIIVILSTSISNTTSSFSWPAYSTVTTPHPKSTLEYFLIP